MFLFGDKGSDGFLIMKKELLIFLSILLFCSCENRGIEPKDDLVGTIWKETNAASGWHHHCLEFVSESSFLYQDTGDRPALASMFLWGNGVYSRNNDNLTFDFITDTKLLPSEARVVNGHELKLLSGIIYKNTLGVPDKIVIKYTITHIIHGADYETEEYESSLFRTISK